MPSHVVYLTCEGFFQLNSEIKELPVNGVLIIEDNDNQKANNVNEDEADLDEQDSESNEEDVRRLPLSARLEREDYIPPVPISPPTIIKKR